MKHLVIVLALLLLAGTACKTKSKTQSQTVTSTTSQTEDSWSGSTKTPAKSQGKVSHQYRATGCKTVIVVKTEDAANPMVLIPITALAEEFDKDGLTIFFNYTLSRIKNPEGCTVGIPANFTDVSLK